MIAQAINSASAPVRIPMNTELPHHTTTNNHYAMESVSVKHFSTNGRHRHPQNVVTTPRSPKRQNVICGKACTF